GADEPIRDYRAVRRRRSPPADRISAYARLSARWYCMRSLLPLSVPRPQRCDHGAPVQAGVMARTVSRIAAMWSVAGVDNPYSSGVALLKRGLPAVGVLLLLLIAVWPQLTPIWERMRFAFPAIDLRDARELRMLNPRYAGMDRSGRPYVVTAAVGHQVPD